MAAAMPALLEFAVNLQRAPVGQAWAGEAALVALLERELEFLRGGGYTRGAETPWRPKWLLLDSPVCARPEGAGCLQCPLRAALPAAVAERALAPGEPLCYRLVITARGETLGGLQRSGPTARLTEAYAAWLGAELRARAPQVAARAPAAMVGAGPSAPAARAPRSAARIGRAA
ncbi:MAG TPA: hypothetical protein VMV31_05265 [Terriglobales bacterium]|nr:hypothetical protein [Terriglobales bacterium]